MQNSIRVYGLQHLVHNINLDVHKELQWWPEFFKRLKVFEALLCVGERRRRFQFYCVMGSVLEHESYKLDKWSKRLYESRWREVVAFLKRLAILLHIFWTCWSEEKYARGEDVPLPADDALGDDGAAQGADANATSASELPFDAKMLSEAIHNNFFHAFLTFTLEVDRMPERDLASWGEGCACHEPLFELGRGMNDYQRGKLIEAHFGKGTSTCPLAGKRADEMAANRLKHVFGTAWKRLEKRIWDKLWSQGTHTLTGEEQAFLQKEMGLARATQFSLLIQAVDESHNTSDIGTKYVDSVKRANLLAMLPLMFQKTCISKIAVIGALMCSTEAHSVLPYESTDISLYQRLVGRAKRMIWSVFNVTTAFFISVCINLMIFLRAILGWFHGRRQGRVLKLQRQLAQMKLESFTVQQLRQQAISVGYEMDSSKITKQLLIPMIMAKADDQYLERLLQTTGHTSRHAK